MAVSGDGGRKYCEQCGEANAERARFCGRCGSPMLPPLAEIPGVPQREQGTVVLGEGLGSPPSVGERPAVEQGWQPVPGLGQPPPIAPAWGPPGAGQMPPTPRSGPPRGLIAGLLGALVVLALAGGAFLIDNRNQQRALSSVESDVDLVESGLGRSSSDKSSVAALRSELDDARRQALLLDKRWIDDKRRSLLERLDRDESQLRTLEASVGTGSTASAAATSTPAAQPTGAAIGTLSTSGQSTLAPATPQPASTGTAAAQVTGTPSIFGQLFGTALPGQPTLTPGAAEPRLVLSDDFNGQCFFQAESAERKAGCENGHFTVINRISTPRWIYYDQDLDDLTIEVETGVSGSQGGYLESGVVFRAAYDEKSSNLSAFYAYMMSNHGRHALFRFQDQTPSWVTLQDYADSGIARSEGGMNRLKVVALGDKIALYVNDKLQQTVTDSTLRRGTVGLFVNNEKVGASATWDNLRVWQLGNSAPSNRPTGIPDRPSGTPDRPSGPPDRKTV